MQLPKTPHCPRSCLRANGADHSRTAPQFQVQPVCAGCEKDSRKTSGVPSLAMSGGGLLFLRCGRKYGADAEPRGPSTPRMPKKMRAELNRWPM